MTSLKTVLLGSAAALVATGAAQAADLPVKKAAAAVQYVEVCPVYGAGFYKLPGTDICIRHFGYVKFGVGFQDKREYVDPDGEVRILSGGSNTTGWQWSVRPGWDFRSPTEWGTLRAVVQLRVDMRAGTYENRDPNLMGTQRVNNMVHRGYIEWAGFTIGKAGTNFVYWDQDDVISAIGGEPKESIPMMITYTLPLGAGIKATIGLETTDQWTEDYIILRPPAVDALAFGPFVGFGGWDIVGSLSAEGPWGNAKIAGLWHFQQLAIADFTGRGADPWSREHTSGAYGILGGITFMLPQLGQGDQLLLEAMYCKGVSHGCGGTGGGAANTATQFERSGQYLEGLQRFDVDGYIVANATGRGFSIADTKWWGFAGQFRHYWAPLWRTNIMGSYQKIETPAIAKRFNLEDGGLGDARVWDVGANLIWGRNRRTAEIGVELLYKSVNQDLPNGQTQRDINALRGVRGSTDVDPEGWTLNAFIQRSW